MIFERFLRFQNQGKNARKPLILPGLRGFGSQRNNLFGALEPESSASANSAIPANAGQNRRLVLYRINGDLSRGKVHYCLFSCSIASQKAWRRLLNYLSSCAKVLLQPKKIGAGEMISFEIMEKSRKEEILPELFDLLFDNMSVIAPTGNDYETDFNEWYSAVYPAIDKIHAI